MAAPEGSGLPPDVEQAPSDPTPVTSGKNVADVPADGAKNPEDKQNTDREDPTSGVAETLEDAPLVTESENGGALEDPIEILVGLAERGEIDPWNINIIEVTDRFLKELERRRELNLKLSGRTLFYAATLLRMKSEQLEILAAPEDEESEDDDGSFGEDYDGMPDGEIEYTGRLGIIERLEHEIQRRLDRKNMRKSPITLFELITELKNIEKEERRRRRMAADPSEAFLIDADDVVSIAHDEGYQASSSVVLEECLSLLEIDGEMTLAELCEKLGWGMPEVYIPLLFLAHEGRCQLRQEEFFGDIWVQLCRVEEEELVSGSGSE
ncbi:MAG: segregation/condensation protein A [Methanomicrobiales archaeon HGW-Methanomicrobiales-1]|jgi:segregation and condensation protein A|nr:MAG: segregation/condensation protein A [Methanomicrobiales archaeon HGW-Methanomicrobiales-1]